MDTSQWYYTRGGAQQGPVTFDELRRLAETGQFGPGDLVWKEGMPQWQPAHQATPFFGAAPPPAPQAAFSPGNLPPGYAPAGYAPPGYAQPGYAPPGYSPPGAPIGYATPRPSSIGDDAGMRMLIPVGRSPWAIVAGYLGLFSILGCVGPVAIIVSIIAIRDIKAHPDKHGMGRAIFGLVMGIIGTIVFVGMMAGGVFGSRR